MARNWWTLALVCAAAHVLLLDIMIGNVAVPAIHRLSSSRTPGGSDAGYSRRVRGSPKWGRTLLSNRAMAEMRSPSSASTSSPTAWAIGACASYM
jgi:hypothetical protein